MYEVVSWKRKRLAGRVEPTEPEPGPLRIAVVQTKRDDALAEEVPEYLEQLVPVLRMKRRRRALVGHAGSEIHPRVYASVDVSRDVLDQRFVLIVA